MSPTYNVKSIIKAALIFVAVLLSTKAIADVFASPYTSTQNVTSSSVWQQMGQWMYHGAHSEHSYQCPGMMGNGSYQNRN